MKLFWTFLIAAGTAGSPAGAGTITGHVHAEGKAQVAQDANCGNGNYDSRALKFATRVDYSAMRDFVVYIEGPVGDGGPIAPGKPLQVVTTRHSPQNMEVLQKKATFVPHILPVVVGSTVEWPNNDDIFHNVFSFSEARSFDLDLYKAPVVKSVTFDKPGRVDVFCSIHSSMNCVVLVLENPCFAVANEKGMYVITNVPAGAYKLKAWHERLPARRQEITVPENGEVKVDFTLGINGLPKL